MVASDTADESTSSAYRLELAGALGHERSATSTPDGACFATFWSHWGHASARPTRGSSYCSRASYSRPPARPYCSPAAGHSDASASTDCLTAYESKAGSVAGGERAGRRGKPEAHQVAQGDHRALPGGGDGTTDRYPGPTARAISAHLEAPTAANDPDPCCARWDL